MSEDINVEPGCEVRPIGVYEPVRVRLIDLQVTLGFYAALMALVSFFEPLRMIHFTISGSIALFVLTVRLCRNRASELESSVQFSHFSGAVGHALILALKLGYPKKIIDNGQGKPLLQIIGFFLLFIAAVMCLISVMPIVKSGVREQRYGLMCYGLLGALPFSLDLAYLHYGML